MKHKKVFLLKNDGLDAIDKDYFSYLSVLQDKEADDEKVKEIEEKFFSLLKALNEDTRQLSEFMIEEGNMIKDLCTYLRKIFSQLDLSIVLPLIAVPWVETCKEVILNSQGHLILVKNQGEVESKSLENYPPDVILMVIWSVIPQLKELVNSYMKRVSMRVNFFERTGEELKNIQKSFEISTEEASENTYEDFREKSVREVLVPKK